MHSPIGHFSSEELAIIRAEEPPSQCKPVSYTHLLKSVISEFSAYKVTSEVLEGVLPTLEKRPVLQKKLRDICLLYTSPFVQLRMVI